MVTMFIFAILLATPLLVHGQDEVTVPDYDPNPKERLHFNRQNEDSDPPGVQDQPLEWELLETNFTEQDVASNPIDPDFKLVEKLERQNEYPENETDFQRDSEDDDRIVLGESVSPLFIPHQVWIGNCGGSRIANRLILTAAHCVRTGQRRVVYFLVRQVGNRGKANFTILGTAMRYPGYRFPRNDVAVIVLDKAPPSSIVIPETYFGVIPLQCIFHISGYGSWGFQGTSNDPVPRNWNLQDATVKSVALLHGGRVVRFDDDVSSGTRPVQAACYGDSGGPAQRYNGTINGVHQWTVVASTSYGYTRGGPQCGGTGSGSIGLSHPWYRFSMYATLRYQYSWILAKANGSGGGLRPTFSLTC